MQGTGFIHLGLTLRFRIRLCCVSARSSVGACAHKVWVKSWKPDLRTINAGIPQCILLRVEAIGSPAFGLLLWTNILDTTLLVQAPIATSRSRYLGSQFYLRAVFLDLSCKQSLYFRTIGALNPNPQTLIKP